MKKKIYIFAFASLIGGLFANAERFQYDGVWYETLSNNTCQTAACTTLYLDLVKGTDQVQHNGLTIDLIDHEKLELKGNPDPIAAANYISQPAGPNFKWDGGRIVVIPEKVYDSAGREYTVTRIGEFSFAGDNGGLTSLILPETVTEIGEGAFFGSDKLSTLDLNSVVKIGTGAFYRTTSLKVLRIPDTTTYIGDFAFSARQQWSNSGKDMDDFYIGKNVEYIGKYAFYLNTIRKNDKIVLPSTLKRIGYMAFSFTRTAGTAGAVENVICNSPVPPVMEVDSDGCTAFGNRREDVDNMHGGSGFYNMDHFWEYTYFCLHVPAGSYAAYKSDPYWSKFSCIQDDLVTEEEMSLDEVVGYVYMAPGDVTQVDPNILPGFNERWGSYTDNIDPSWESGDNTVAEITEDGKITAIKYGKKLAVAKANIGNQIWNGSTWEDVEEIVGVIVIYVCPTVVLATNLNESDLGVAQDNPNIGGDSSSDGSTGDDGMRVLADNDTPVIAESEYPAPATEDYATYEHLVVPESFPQFKITPAYGFEITNTMHGDAADDKSWTEADLVDLVDGDYDTDTEVSKDEVAIALEEPITNNRVVYIEINQIEGMDLGTTGVQEFEVANNLKVRVDGTTISIEGAADNDVVRVSNLKGQTVLRTAEKSFTVGEVGMYLVTVGDKKSSTTFKVIVR